MRTDKSRATRVATALLGVLAVTAGSAVALSAPRPAAAKAPPPYGEDRTEIDLTIERDGTVAVEETLRWDSYRRGAERHLNGSVHEGFRLPSTDDFPVPPYLRPTWTEPKISAKPLEDPLEPEIRREGHALLFDAPGTYDSGGQTARVTYRITGAARQAGDVVEIYFRPLTDSDITSVTINGPGLLGVECVKIPPDRAPCGTGGTEGGERGKGGSDKLVIDVPALARQHPEVHLWGEMGNEAAELVVLADPDAYDLAEPVIDRGRVNDQGRAGED